MAERKTRLPWGMQKKGLAPPSNISESKLKAFNIGKMSIVPKVTKRDIENEKKKADEAMLGDIYSEFVESFDTSSKINRTWVKGGTVNQDTNKPPLKKVIKKLYKPTSMLSSKKNPVPMPTIFLPRNKTPVAKKPAHCSNNKIIDKKKSNLESFKEELRRMQEVREERKVVKDTYSGSSHQPTNSTSASNVSMGIYTNSGSLPSQLGLAHDDSKSFAYDNEAMSTNLYLGNINPECTEEYLCKLFGSFGALASVKIMWPRTDESRSRNRNSGFVAFMSRRDAERCITNLQGKRVQNYEMKLGWGKVVPLPGRPVYIPPQLCVDMAPPPSSGLPFNAQSESKKYIDTRDMDNYELEQLLMNCVVKVTIPRERSELMLIHRVIEFVIREGPMFEAIIMNRSLNNPNFEFLFNNKSVNHIYYRWKLYSVLQGDSVKRWRTKKFRMFKGGSWWQPPAIIDYTTGMTDDVYAGIKKEKVEKIDKFTKEILTNKQAKDLTTKLRRLTTNRHIICDTMVWCIDNSDFAFSVVDIICTSFENPSTIPMKKIARLYLVSDILHNSSAKVHHAAFYRKFFETKLPNMFYEMYKCYSGIQARLKAEQFKQRVMACFNAWDDWAIYPNDLLIKLQNIFLGLAKPVGKDGDSIEMVSRLGSSSLSVLSSLHPQQPSDDEEDDNEDEDHDIDDDPDIDGVEMDELDIDGTPMENDEQLLSLTKEEGSEVKPSKSNTGGFIKSKWESVDESKLEDQAMTTSKWDELDATVIDDEDIDGCPMEDTPPSPLRKKSPQEPQQVDPDVSKSNISEEKRLKLRDIEVKVMRYQDDIESGRRSRKDGMNLNEQCKYYRQKLIDRDQEKDKDTRSVSLVNYIDSPSSTESRDKNKSRTSRRNSRSPKRHRRSRSNSRDRSRRSHRSRSPKPRSRHSRSRSPRRKHKKSRR